jgi:pilus assembly protein TadC
MMWLVAVAVVMAVVLGSEGLPRRRQRRRWERVLEPSELGERGRRRTDAAGALRRVPLPTLAAVASAVLILTVVPWPVALPLAGVAAAAAPFALSRLGTLADRERERRMAAELPLLLDLLAAAWASGAPGQRVVAVVGQAMEGPWRSDLERMAARVAWGASWGDALDDSMLRRLAAPAADAIVTAQAWGTAPAAALAQSAATARDARRRQGEAAARAVAVSVVGPLGLCFLPAFVLLGIAPAVLGAIDAMVN